MKLLLTQNVVNYLKVSYKLDSNKNGYKTNVYKNIRD